MTEVDLRQGVLTGEDILALIASGAIRGESTDRRRVQPASLDLTLGRRAWRVRASFLPSPDRRVEARLSSALVLHDLDLEGGAVLERGCVYIVELGERLHLPRGVAAAANPKSSTGRIDVFVRLVTDHGAQFDAVPEAYEGPLYAEISPRTFSILVRKGSTLNQARFKRGRCRLDDDELADLAAATPLLDAPANIDGGLGLRARIAGAAGEIIGWRARRHAALIDVDSKGVLAPADFFEPIAAPASGFIILDPDEFYILASREAVAVPPRYAAEMAPVNTGLGEFRVHYAGFFDPGFGWNCGRPPTSRAVLEVRSRDAPFVLEDGQLVARLVYERLTGEPQTLYGAALASNYQGQALKLSKHFTAPTSTG